MSLITLELMKTLRRNFTLANVGFFFCLIAGYFIHNKDKTPLLGPAHLKTVGTSLFILTMIFTVALPILIRVRFHQHALAFLSINPSDYGAFQKKLMISVGIGTALAGLSYILVIPDLYLYASVLAALYGIYSILPSRRKVMGELRAYGYSDESSQED